MSRVHLSFIKVELTDVIARYRVETADFNDAGMPEEIGYVEIDRTNRTYQFTPTNIWVNYRFVPPWVYGLNNDEQQRLLTTQFNGYEAGGWTASIHRRVCEMIGNDRYPQ